MAVIRYLATAKDAIRNIVPKASKRYPIRFAIMERIETEDGEDVCKFSVLIVLDTKDDSYVIQHPAGKVRPFRGRNSADYKEWRQFAEELLELLREQAGPFTERGGRK